MKMIQNPHQIVYTNEARCLDCYRCLRVCPVKAIKMDNEQAYVVEELCIGCGTCIRECPQKAKTFRNDLDILEEILKSPGDKAVSIAPSYASVYENWKSSKIPALLKKLGFTYAAETSVGAYAAALKTHELAAKEKNKPHIGSACPAFVSYIEKYHKELTPYIINLMSPMLVHASHLKRKLGDDTKIVFIGPCIAKKEEADKYNQKRQQLVDAVITFEELNELIDKKGIDLAKLPDSDFDEEPVKNAKYFPVAGGMLKTASLNTDLMALDAAAVHGFDEVDEIIENIKHYPRHILIEPLMCHHGCINGPAAGTDKDVYRRKNELIKYAEKKITNPEKIEDLNYLEFKDIINTYEPFEFSEYREVSESEIQKIFEETGKFTKEDQLNCGACGYNTCREKAIAVVKGLAQKEMCMPYMRRIAEKRTDKIIETSPNGVLILDNRLNIVNMNPAFKKFFMCSDAVIGKRISYLIDPEPFEVLSTGSEEILEKTVNYKKYNLICHQLMYALRDEKRYIGIFVDITNAQISEEKLKTLKRQAVEKAKELLEHQINMAQEMAKLLGESTARGEELVENLLSLAEEEPEEKIQQKRGWKTSLDNLL